MCGRFVIFSNLEQLQDHFPIDKALSEVTPNYNVASTQEILAIIQHEGLNILEKLNWGLVPHWAKDISTGYKMINARMETVSSKPGFRDAFRKRRCHIPADEFYEWKGPKGDKQSFFITLPDKKPFAFSGLLETWWDKDNENEPYRSCSIITRDASASLKHIHDRMPAVLPRDTYEKEFVESMLVEVDGCEIRTVLSEQIEDTCEKTARVCSAGQLSERVKAGLHNAKRNGKRLGRPPLSPRIIEKANQLRSEGLSYRKIGKKLGISEGMVRKGLKNKE